ncbi:hypothetical protein Tco_0077325 [Tanacetum coccineum]
MANMELCDIHNMVAFLQKPTGSDGFYEIVDFLAGSHIRYALTTNPTICVSHIKQFWQTATVRTFNNGEQHITTTVNGKAFTITEASVRRHLQLINEDGINMLPNTEFFAQLTLMGNMRRGFVGEHTPLFPSMLVHDQIGQGEGPTTIVEFQHTPTVSLSITLTPPQATPPFTSQQQPTTKTVTEPVTTPIPEPPLIAPTTSSPSQYDITTSHSPTMPYDSPSHEVINLEKDLKNTKLVYRKALTKLVKKVRKGPSKRRNVIDAEVQGRQYDEEFDFDSILGEGFQSPSDRSKGIKLTRKTDSPTQDSPKVHLSVLSAAKILAEAANGGAKTFSRKKRVRVASTGSTKISTAGDLFSIADDAEVAKKLHNEELAKAAVREEQERLDLEKALELQKQMDARIEDIDWNIFAEQVEDQRRHTEAIEKYQALKRRPVTEAQARKNMMIYLKNTTRYKMDYFKRMRYDEIKPIFEKEYNRMQILLKKDPKETNVEASDSDPVQEQSTKEPEELSKEELKKMLAIVPVEEFIIRVGNFTETCQSFVDMVKRFDRDDLVQLWSLVKKRFKSAQPTEDMERSLWVELKRLFEPDEASSAAQQVKTMKLDDLRVEESRIHEFLEWKEGVHEMVHGKSSFLFQKGLTLILATLEALEVDLLGDGIVKDRQIQGMFVNFRK